MILLVLARFLQKKSTLPKWYSAINVTLPKWYSDHVVFTLPKWYSAFVYLRNNFIFVGNKKTDKDASLSKSVCNLILHDMTKIKKTSEFSEIVYPKFNPTGLVNDIHADHKYRSNVLHNNRRKLLEIISHEAIMLVCYLDLLMKPNKHDIVQAITYDLKREYFPFLSRRNYPLVIQELIDRNIIVKVNNNLANRLFYINPCIVCKLTKEQKNEFAMKHKEYFNSL